MPPVHRVLEIGAWLTTAADPNLLHSARSVRSRMTVAALIDAALLAQHRSAAMNASTRHTTSARLRSRTPGVT
jgi:hypothetical protein